MPEPWLCPYCNRHQTIGDQDTSTDRHNIRIFNAIHPIVVLQTNAIVCTNVDCRSLVLFGVLYKAADRGSGILQRLETVHRWALLPASSAKPLPEFIPKALRDDYYEACAIRSLSPKAAATLARRCLQGMLRDFCGITKRTLFDEIAHLKKMLEEDRAPRGVSAESIDAIDAIRSIGNIGAHMDRDISLIIEIDPEEAQVLLHLIETLFEEWYVARHDRAARFARVAEIADAKKALTAPAPPPRSPAPES